LSAGAPDNAAGPSRKLVDKVLTEQIL